LPISAYQNHICSPAAHARWSFQVDGSTSSIRSTVEAHHENQLFLEGPFRGQVNQGIQTTYDERGRYDEPSDPKYIDTGGIFDIMAVTVIQSHLAAV
jgi:type I restriction enzyme R subunit